MLDEFQLYSKKKIHDYVCFKCNTPSFISWDETNLMNNYYMMWSEWDTRPAV